jgi:hypothetical protein
MVPVGAAHDKKPIQPPFDKGSQLGKRYQDPDGTIEILCTKAGLGSLAVRDELLTFTAPKPLPASD